MQRAKKLKQEEKKVILAYAQLKLKANRLSKELDTMKQNVVDCFERTNQNLRYGESLKLATYFNY